MRRGTTPTITITTDTDLSGASNLFVTFAQRGKIIIEKTLADVTITSEAVTVELTQADTLALSADRSVQFQIRATVGSAKLASNIMSADVDEILKAGEI